MTKMAELAAVAHNIAHHAASGLSFLSPHLAQALRLAGEETTAIELLVQHPYPPKIAEIQSLRLALASPRGWSRFAALARLEQKSAPTRLHAVTQSPTSRSDAS